MVFINRCFATKEFRNLKIFRKKFCKPMISLYGQVRIQLKNNRRVCITVFIIYISNIFKHLLHSMQLQLIA